jgi:hypothetical protein
LWDKQIETDIANGKLDHLAVHAFPDRPFRPAPGRGSGGS